MGVNCLLVAALSLFLMHCEDDDCDEGEYCPCYGTNHCDYHCGDECRPVCESIEHCEAECGDACDFHCTAGTNCDVGCNTDCVHGDVRTCGP